MMRIVVIDDEPLARGGVIARLRDHDDIEMVGDYGDGQSALQPMLDNPPDLAFVDVDMPGMSGLELLAALPPPVRPMAIMLTAYDNFAIRAFELQAIDYLLKPIDDLRFAEALDRARQALPYRLPAPMILKRFSARIGARIVFIDAADVDWIEADGDYAALHAGNATYLIREPLHKLARQLDPRQFVRVHRSAIVSIGKVSELKMLPNRDALLRMANGTPVRASRTYIDALAEASGRTL